MIPAGSLLAGIPSTLRDPLLEEYKGLIAAFIEGKWKASGLDAGRFCEVAFAIVDGAVRGKYPKSPSKPRDLPQSCKAIESLPPIAVGDRSLRLLIPRTLPPIYEIRNNRDVGHVGGDVVSNKMDATYVVGACTFIMAELIRVFHNCSTNEAQQSVDALVERKSQLVWDFGGGKRVLAPEMSTQDKILVLLYSEPDWVDAAELQAWVKYGHTTRFRSVLGQMDGSEEIIFDSKQDRVKITPLGIKEVETRILKP